MGTGFVRTAVIAAVAVLLAAFAQRCASMFADLRAMGWTFRDGFADDDMGYL